MSTATIKTWIMILLTCGLSSCSIHNTPQSDMNFDAAGQWALLPVINYSQQPLAGERAEAILGTMLQARGVYKLTYYPNAPGDDGLPELNERTRLSNALDWAKTQGFVYGFSGVISEWRYKSGLDAEPAVGITLQILDITNGQVIWSTSAARSGWGRESLSGNAQKIILELVQSIPFHFDEEK